METTHEITRPRQRRRGRVRAVALALATLLISGALAGQARADDGTGTATGTSQTVAGEPGEPPEDPDPIPEPPRQPAEFTWTMPKRFGSDLNGDGLVDYFTPSDFCTTDDATTCAHVPKTTPFDIAPGEWHVDLDACRSLLADVSGATFTWQLVRGTGTISGGPGCGEFDLTVPAEGLYTVKLTVSSSQGSATVTTDVVVQDWLIVSLGDSYGSGEGNPDIPTAHDDFGLVKAGAKWEDRRCHRSADAGSAQAARRLENADPKTSVTFIHVACSGAQAMQGLLEAYDGMADTWEAKYMDPLDPQLTQARELVGNREVDAVYISIGGNDSGFAPVVMSCVALMFCNPAYQDLPADWVIPDVGLAATICVGSDLIVPPPFKLIWPIFCTIVLSGILHDFAGDTAEHLFHNGLIGDGSDDSIPSYRLTGIYNELDAALHATAPGPNGEPYFGLPASQSDRVFISEYIDATTDDDGDYCPKGDFFKPFNDIRIPGLAQKEYEWLDLKVERKLNEVIGANAQSHGWHLVGGIHDRFATHGICADNTYMRGLLLETFWVQGDMDGTAHPNFSGHAVYRDRIISTMLPTLYPPHPGESGDLDLRRQADVAAWISDHSPRLPAQAPVADAGGPYTVAEGSTVQATNGSFDDGPLTSAWSSSNGNIATVAPASASTPTITGVDDGQATLTLGVSDDADAEAEATDTATVTVTNIAPTVGALTTPIAPVALGSAVTASSSYSDPGADDHALTWSWGDGTTTPQTRGVDQDGAISATHTYAASGVFPVSVQVDDHDGGVTSSTVEYVVVFDPSGGFVTGGGTIESPAGALVSDPAATGPATFAFVAKYQKGTSIPTGKTQFRFHAGDFTLESTSYDWLVVSGARAQYKGTATVNGQPGYGFLVTAVDGEKLAKGQLDRLRVKVLDLTTGSIVYDNQPGAADIDAPTTAIAGGQITIADK
jgi:PKD domain